jgi:peptidoglycan/xylan/chitin deacetylase (PgdA/CDA1 family)
MMTATPAPALEGRNLRGTFYLTGSRPSVFDKVPQWKAALKSGHEIGNHTWSHPCEPQIYSPAFGDIDTFIHQETGKTEGWFDENDLKNGYRSYAYPCGIFGLGPPGTAGVQEQRYKAVCEMTFNNARLAGGPPNDPALVLGQRFLLGSCAGTWGQDTATLSINYCQDSLVKGFWGILAFHDLVEGVVTSAGQTRVQVHAEILDWLVAHADDIWVAPVMEIYQYVISH